MKIQQRKPESAWQLFWLRQRYIVDLKLQLSIYVAWVLQTLFMLVVIAATIFGPRVVEFMNDDRIYSGAVIAAEELIVVDPKFWPALLFGLILCALISFRFSHRIAGPLVAFKRALNLVIEGEAPSSFKVREGDLLQDEAKLLSAAVAKFSEQQQELHEARELIDRAIDALRDDGRAENLGLTRQLKRTSAEIRALTITRGDEE